MLMFIIIRINLTRAMPLLPLPFASGAGGRANNCTPSFGNKGHPQLDALTKDISQTVGGREGGIRRSDPRRRLLVLLVPLRVCVPGVSRSRGLSSQVRSGQVSASG